MVFIGRLYLLLVDLDDAAEPAIPSEDAIAAARYMYLLEYGFPPTEAMKIAEMDVDLHSYMQTSSHLSKV